MKGLISSWVRGLPQSGIREVYHEALRLPGVIHLEIGDPDFPTPGHIIDEACNALREGYTHYTHNAGIIELREAISDYYARLYGVRFDAERNVAVTLGSTEAIFLSLLAVLEPGDEVLIPDPGYPSYTPMVLASRGVPRRYRLSVSEGFTVDPGEVEARITERTKAIIVNNPHNPTGSITGIDRLERLARLASDYGILVIADEVYDRIVYDGVEFHSMAEISRYRDNIVVVNSFSKTFAMTGWRIGFIVTGNEELISTVTRLQEGVAACAPAAFQVAAARALRGPWEPVERMVREYRVRRDRILEILDEAEGLSYVRPMGTFYVFVDVSSRVSDSRRFALRLLRERRVAVAPGSAFGPGGEGYVRLSYAASLSDIERGVRGFVEFFSGYREV